MLKCSYCDKEFKYESERKRHEQSHSPQFECQECLKKFSFLSALRRHQKQHTRTGAVQCKECGRDFRDENLLLRHTNYAHKGTYACSKCNRKLSSELALASHMKMHISKAERRFQCPYNGCTKSFNYLHHLKHHKLTHTDMKQYHCDLCGKGFIQAHHLKSHLKSHDSENWIHCSVLKCKKSFATEYALRRHIATHKNTVDSGISSESDISQDLVNETLICPSCEEIYTKSSYERHKVQCVPKEYRVDPIILEAIGEENPRLPIEMDRKIANLNYAVDDRRTSFNLDSGTFAKEKDIFDDREVAEIADTSDTAEKQQKDTNNTCNGCHCMNSNNISKNSMRTSNTPICCDDNNTPKIDYRSDGTIKILQTFDLEFSNIVKRKKPEKIKRTNNVFNFEPFNSCKDVLGKCIVSGNGTISDECLCAKMAFDERQVIEQEIDEITPYPVIQFT